MDLSSIGKYIRNARTERGISQEKLAEMTNLSVAYIGMIERGKKTPKLETFLTIINTLQISSDLVLRDVTSIGYQVQMSVYLERIQKLPERRKDLIYKILELLIMESES